MSDEPSPSGSERCPEGQKLCHQHFIGALQKSCDLCGEREAVTYTPADDDICQECGDEIIANYNRYHGRDRDGGDAGDE